MLLSHEISNKVKFFVKFLIYFSKNSLDYIPKNSL